MMNEAAACARLGRIGPRWYENTMTASSSQLALFESDPTPERGQEANARQRMRAMIDRLRDASVPPWRDEMGAILDEGAFQRAMRMVPAQETQALRAEFDVHMERLYEAWLDLGHPQAE